MFNLKKESPIPPRSKEPSARGLLGQINMKTTINIEGKEFTIEQLKELINKNEDKLEAVELYLDIYKKSRL